MSSERWWQTLGADDILTLRRRVLSALRRQFAATPVAEVEDAVHQAFVALFRNRERISADNDGLYRYLLVAARRSALDRLRTVRLRESRRSDVAARVLPAEMDDESARREKNEAIREIFCELGELDRLILWSHVVDGRSINAIARELGVNWHRVAQAVERAVRRIRRRLAD